MDKNKILNGIDILADLLQNLNSRIDKFNFDNKSELVHRLFSKIYFTSDYNIDIMGIIPDPKENYSIRQQQ